jgi:tricorn protease
MKNSILFFTFIVITCIGYSQTESRLMRFPAIHGDKIVFSYAGDLYSVISTGGNAVKLTNHDGYEMFPRISPDGKSIAFTAQYDGNTEVYVMNIDGGIPKRLTYTATLGRDDISDRMGPNNIVMTWTPDGKYIIYRSRCQTFNDFRGQLFKVSVDGGMSEAIPILDGGFCSYSPDGQKLAFNMIFREFRTWKRYSGGMADDIRIYDFTSKTVEKITDSKFQDVFPMWYKNKIYFLSDRDKTMNMFCYEIDTKTTSKITDFTEFDMKFPSINGNKIVFENAGYLYVFDCDTEKYQKISVIINDNNIYSRNKLVDVSKAIASVDISSTGTRLTVSARGEIFSIPGEKGIKRNLTGSSGVHERNPVWSPDGKNIAFLSDKTGEFEIYIQDAEGAKDAIQLTSGADTYIFDIKWSPDSKKIAWSDKKMRLRYIDIATKMVIEVSKSDVWEYRDYKWSPDSKWLVFTSNEPEGISRIYLFSLVNTQKSPATDIWFNCNSPSFSDDGKYLFFASARNFNPTYNDVEWNIAYGNMEKIYFILLANDTKSPFALENKEEGESKEELKKDEKPDENLKKSGKTKKDITETDKSKEVKDIKIDINGIFDRVVEVPVTSANYGNINMVDNNLYYFKFKDGETDYTFNMYDFKEKKETELGSNMGYKLSSDLKKMLIIQKNTYYIIDIPKSKIELKTPVDLSGMNVNVNLKQEWNQIFYESWRQMRDFFYDPGMHGTDWVKLKEKYAQLLPYVNHRNDLNYIIGELIAELSIGHAYVGGGIRPEVERINTGLLGAQFTKDASGYFKITKILKGANWDKSLKSPITEPGLNVNENNYVIEVNGTSLKDVPDIYSLLIGTAGNQIELTVNTLPQTDGSRKILVVPIEDESELYYYNWVQNNIKKVSDATNGQVGYIHIPDMSSDGYNKFTKLFYPQLRKKALIIDDRGNGGGNVSPIIIERLRRENSYFGMARNTDYPSFNPDQTHIGPKVLLLDQYSASDGDLFPSQFKYYKLGKTIGVRSWGGVVGIRGSLPFIDGGTLMKPEFAPYSKDGKEWIIEGYGVDPDIIVENNPAEAFMGKDAQLDKAIEVILKEMETYNEKIYKHPEFPDKH